MALAIFDLDNTLIANDSDYLWGEYMADEGIVDADSFRKRNLEFFHQYEQGVLDINDYLTFSLEPLSHHSMAQLLKWHEDFMTKNIRPIMLDKARKLLQKHRNQGDYLMIITATNRFVTEPIAAEFGVDTLLAIDAEIRDGRYTGRVSGTPTFRDGKVIRLNEWLKDNPAYSMTGSYFYSDSKNDLPLLERVEHPVAVDPDPVLESTARERNWPVISLR